MTANRPAAPSYPVPPPDRERPALKDGDQECQKCGATFRWQPESEAPRAPLRLSLIKGSSKCDCGYGRPRKA